MIGVFDSGIGGLSVLHALRAELPHQDFLYVADSGHAPYGERDDAHVMERSRRIAGWLAGQDATALVVACNTATAAAVDGLRGLHPALPVIGVEPAVKPAVALSRTGRIGVMATRGTLNSVKFKALLARHADAARFVLQPCDGLAEAIERSAASGDAAETMAACARHTAAMGCFGAAAGGIDTLVLGCTHYPFAEASLRTLLGPEVQLVSTGQAVARQAARQGAAAPEAGDARRGTVRLFSTGDAGSLQAAAGRWLGVHSRVGLLQF
ncbi:MAG: murI [Polaromonas sp.]|nr:murI [Polaromonas sp.]